MSKKEEENKDKKEKEKILDKKEEIEESELEEEIGQVEDTIDEHKFQEILKSHKFSPTLEQVAIAPEQKNSLEVGLAQTPIKKDEKDEISYKPRDYEEKDKLYSEEKRETREGYIVKT